MPIQGTPSGIIMGELFNISVFPYTSNANKIISTVLAVLAPLLSGDQMEHCWLTPKRLYIIYILPPR